VFLILTRFQPAGNSAQPTIGKYLNLELYVSFLL
jgi:hypothetical protein